MQPDYYEIDFLAVGDKKSGDAIALRYRKAGETYIHVIDGGYSDNGKELAELIKKYYGADSFINHVVLTHPHADHAGGLSYILENFNIGTFWTLKPWELAPIFIECEVFSHWKNANNLEKHLKDKYAYAAELVEIANKRGIKVREPFQEEKIGAFTVLAPSHKLYIQQLIASNKTPETARKDASPSYAADSASTIINKKAAAWGEEYFPEEGTDAENEMTIVQLADLCGQRIMLTGDAGRKSLECSIQYAYKKFNVGTLISPALKIDKFQVPHHGGRHNLSVSLLDKLFGPKFLKESDFIKKFTAIISAGESDPHHPKDSVVRALIHRGGRVIETKGSNLRTKSTDAPPRENYSIVEGKEYPREQEQ